MRYDQPFEKGAVIGSLGKDVTPAARIQTSIEIIDCVLAGDAAERALTNWARRSRFAGSGDRYAVRDLVFDALRRQRSYAWLGGGKTGRAVMLGRCRAQSLDPEVYFSGARYAPVPLDDFERKAPASLEEAPVAVRCDVQDWVLPLLVASLGEDADNILARMRDRAPVFLRSNSLKCTREEAIEVLREDGFDACSHSLAETAIMVEGNSRKLSAAKAVRDGLVEFQDASSQAVVDRLSAFLPDASVLDFCAGGGGKTLAVAAYKPKLLIANDLSKSRMGNIDERAARAGAQIIKTTKPEGLFDLVICDAPCSGSGAWRRQPDAKWRLNTKKLKKFVSTQAEILSTAKMSVLPGGHLAYITCSLLRQENEERIAHFLSQNRDWTKIDQFKLTPLSDGDGFYLAVMRAPSTIR
ncbi:MAG: RsmB/NOP family class I SAM-dependent RNA methyltransferase [Boseongicola sp.]